MVKTRIPANSLRQSDYKNHQSENGESECGHRIKHQYIVMRELLSRKVIGKWLDIMGVRTEQNVTRFQSNILALRKYQVDKDTACKQ